MSRNINKLIQLNNKKQDKELIISDEDSDSLANSMQDICTLTHLTRLNLSHNGLEVLDASIINLAHLEYLNLFNNNLEELPVTISTLPKLRELNAAVNRLVALPRGFGSCPALQVLDLTYNNLSNQSLPANFRYLNGTLRALFIGDNELTFIPMEISMFSKLEVLVVRDNNIREVPAEIGRMTKLKELHLNGNQISILPPELGQLDFSDHKKSFFRVFDNPLMEPLKEQYEQMKNNSDLFIKYLKSPQYLELYCLHTTGMHSGQFPTDIKRDRSNKKSRKTNKFKLEAPPRPSPYVSTSPPTTSPPPTTTSNTASPNMDTDASNDRSNAALSGPITDV